MTSLVLNNRAQVDNDSSRFVCTDKVKLGAMQYYLTFLLTLLHSERPKLCGGLAVLCAIGLIYLLALIKATSIS